MRCTGNCLSVPRTGTVTPTGGANVKFIDDLQRSFFLHWTASPTTGLLPVQRKYFEGCPILFLIEIHWASFMSGVRHQIGCRCFCSNAVLVPDRKSTRLNSSH